MKKQNKIAMGMAALLLILVYLFPIWSIELQAPQYPEGMGLNIWVDTIEGKEPQDLQNINGLNHYIGMQAITPDSIPELKIMPVLFAILIVTGLVTAIWGDRKWVFIWLGAFGVMALAGLIDFYLWEYDYGHNLDPSAPIKIPGMSYQPPLIGSKQLLNIKATSLPHIGFYISLLSMALAGWTWWDEGKTGNSDDKSEEIETKKAA